jgi:UDP-glucose 4-epimerase
MKLTRKNVLVTGGSGFIPSHIVDALVSKGCNVTVIDNLKDSPLSNLEQSMKETSFIKADIRDKSIIESVMKDTEVVFHLGANANVPYSINFPDYDFYTNAVGTFNVLSTCVKHGIEKVVYASTAAVYGEPVYTPMDEEHPLNPISPYGASKLAGERLGFAYHKTFELPFTALRVFNTYGPRQRRYVMYDLLKKIYDNPDTLEVLGTGQQIRDYCYVADTANAFIQIAERDDSVGHVFNIAGGKPISIREIAERIVAISGFASKTKIHYTNQSWNGDITTLVANISKIRDFGFSPQVGLDTGLQNLFNWYNTVK